MQGYVAFLEGIMGSMSLKVGEGKDYLARDKGSDTEVEIVNEKGQWGYR
jgi:hypothetical protein